MAQLQRITLIFSAILVFAACKEEQDLGPEPSACLELSSETIIAGDSLLVSDCSENAAYTEIYFGDGNLLSKSSPSSYVYEKPGSYTVTILAYPENAALDISRADAEVNVLPFAEGQEPEACFNAQLQQNLQVFFANCSQNARYFEWNFGDGAESTDINPTHTYEREGEYTILLKAFSQKGGAFRETERTIVVSQVGEPVACFSTNNSTATPNQSIDFFNCSKNAFQFEWDFGDGTTSNQINPSHSFDESGTYKVILKAFAADRNEFDSTSFTINVGEKFLSGFEIVRFASEKGNGSTWDPEVPFPLPIDGIGVQPDLLVAFKRDFDDDVNTTNIVYDIAERQLPYSWRLRNPIKIADDRWEFTLVDDDGLLGEEDMADWTGKLSNRGEDGVITLQMNDETILRVLYEVQ